MTEERRQVIRIIENVWAYGRCITREEVDILKALVPDGDNKPSLQCALEYLNMWEAWKREGRPTFGAFQRWWLMWGTSIV